MKLSRRRFLSLTLAAAPGATRIARAETYPVRPVKIVSGYPPGGVVDTYARLIGAALSDRLGQQFIVEDHPGAGGTIAIETVINAPADGYSLAVHRD